MTGKVGFLAIARQTFDVPFATATAKKAFQSLNNELDTEVVGTADLAMTAEDVAVRANALSTSDLEAVVVLQATFADSTLIRQATDALDCPLVLWAVPEERTGGRLRLNSLCGINLAAYVLAREGTDYRWVYRSPDDPVASEEIERAIEGRPSTARVPLELADETLDLAPSLGGKRIGLVGSRPDGFEPCDYDADELENRFGVSVDRVELEDLFTAAEAGDEQALATVRSGLQESMEGLGEVDQAELDRSLRIFLGLSTLVEQRGWQGVATRCWPECFTEFGGAACAGNSMLTSLGIPACCEADVYGDVTALLLQEMADTPPFVADLIDIDLSSNTAAFWHCGLAPKELSPDGVRPTATVHSNRKKPLLNEFPLRPGRVTITRLSQSQNQQRLLVAGGEMLDEPLPFSGTSGVARLDTEAGQALDTIMANGLEHHYGIAYGDHQESLRDYASSVGISVIEL